MTTYNKPMVLAILSNTTMLTLALFLSSPREESEWWDKALAVHDPLRHHRRSELVKFQHLLLNTTLNRPPFMRCVLNYLAHALYTRASVCIRKSRIADQSDDTVNHSAKWLWIRALSYLLLTGINLNLPVIAIDKSQNKKILRWKSCSKLLFKGTLITVEVLICQCQSWSLQCAVICV